MAKHKSVEAKRLTELGRGLHAWSNVLLNGASVYDSSDKAAMREIALMADTPENRELLQDAAHRCGLPEHDAELLCSWINGSGDYQLTGLFACQDSMKDYLADYVKDTWPENDELANALRDADALSGWHVKTCADGTTHFTKGRDLLVVWFGSAKDVALSCDGLDNPPIGLHLSLNAGDSDLVLCGTADQAARIVADFLAAL